MTTSVKILAGAVLVAATFLTLLTTSNAVIKNVGDSCQTPNNTAGTCKSLDECPLLKEMTNMPNKPLWVSRYLRKSKCGTYVNGMPVVCCPQPDGPCLSHRINCESCGSSAADRIIGGQECTTGEFPWMAVLNYEVNNGFEDKCGGSLINDKYVLTAAHCITAQLRNIRLGEHDVRTDPDCTQYATGEHCIEPVQNFTIKRTWVHPRYSRTTIVNDIALIQLNKPATLTEYVKPVCLPVEDANLDGRRVTVAGWGITEDKVPSPVLLKANVTIASREQCLATFQRLRITLPLNDNQICAGGDGVTDSCNGDSGGPMMKFPDGSSQYTQYGIVSYGATRCATKGMPAIYTDVSKHMKWILKTIRP